uniref:Uncharacterized protein n=1 Tax=Pristionchus pacificus TaxID=54126 RepID=A0A2A6CES4_PRIPA|eukprot:PDM76616.1 hypothetical protein PRIPAC_42982 [Pristionchus pacificus]
MKLLLRIRRLGRSQGRRIGVASCGGSGRERRRIRRIYAGSSGPGHRRHLDNVCGARDSKFPPPVGHIKTATNQIAQTEKGPPGIKIKDQSSIIESITDQ